MAKKSAGRSSSGSPVSSGRAAGGDGGGAGDTFTSTRRVKELIALMTDNGLTEIELVDGDKRVALRRGVASAGAGIPAVFPGPMAMAYAPAAVGGGGGGGAREEVEEDALVAIKSPMVGTFYAASSPDAPAFVSIGSAVDEKTVVCIIEAMKHFNEIHAEVRGTVAKVLVSNGQVVEYGQALFMVRAG